MHITFEIDFKTPVMYNIVNAKRNPPPTGGYMYNNIDLFKMPGDLMCAEMSITNMTDYVLTVDEVNAFAATVHAAALRAWNVKSPPETNSDGELCELIFAIFADYEGIEFETTTVIK